MREPVVSDYKRLQNPVGPALVSPDPIITAQVGLTAPARAVPAETGHRTNRSFAARPDRARLSRTALCSSAPSAPAGASREIVPPSLGVCGQYTVFLAHT